MIRDAFPKLVKFMKLTKKELPENLPLLEQLLEPEELESVVLAISTGDFSKLPKFQTNRLVLTGTDNSESENRSVESPIWTPKLVCKEFLDMSLKYTTPDVWQKMTKLISAAALKQPKRKSNNSSVCKLVVGRNHKVVSIRYMNLVRNKSQLYEK